MDYADDRVHRHSPPCGHVNRTRTGKTVGKPRRSLKIFRGNSVPQQKRIRLDACRSRTTSTTGGSSAASVLRRHGDRVMKVFAAAAADDNVVHLRTRSPVLGLHLLAEWY